MPIYKRASKIPIPGKMHIKGDGSIIIMTQQSIVCLSWSYQEEHDGSIWQPGASGRGICHGRTIIYLVPHCSALSSAHAC